MVKITEFEDRFLSALDTAGSADGVTTDTLARILEVSVYKVNGVVSTLGKKGLVRTFKVKKENDTKKRLYIKKIVTND